MGSESLTWGELAKTLLLRFYEMCPARASKDAYVFSATCAGNLNSIKVVSRLLNNRNSLVNERVKKGYVGQNPFLRSRFRFNSGGWDRNSGPDRGLTDIILIILFILLMFWPGQSTKSQF